MDKIDYLVAIIIGSDTDRPKVEPCVKTLRDLGIPHRLRTLSCHRDKDELDAYLAELATPDSTVQVVITAAGMAAQLPGVAAASLKASGKTVIGVALSSSNFPDALDALLSITRMPPGVPLVCAGIDSAGAQNAALVAANILVAVGKLRLEAVSDYYVIMAKEKAAKACNEHWPPTMEG